VFEGLKHGRVFVTAGDLVTQLDVIASVAGQTAGAGETLRASAGESVKVVIRFRDPDARNAAGENPRVSRVDLIVGDVRAPGSRGDRNDTTRVVARFTAKDWTSTGDVHQIETALPLAQGMYLRVRGTNTSELEPSMDRIGENPWPDLWFYSNPIFVAVR
jgi:hypothetical protein